jgi:hypothetical protein
VHNNLGGRTAQQQGQGQAVMRKVEGLGFQRAGEGSAGGGQEREATVVRYVVNSCWKCRLLCTAC